MEDRVLLGGGQRLGRGHQLADRDAVEIPSMRVPDRDDLFFSFGKCHVKGRFAAPGTLHEKLKRQRRLAAARQSFDKIESVLDQAPIEKVVESGTTGRDTGWRVGHELVESAGEG